MVHFHFDDDAMEGDTPVTATATASSAIPQCPSGSVRLPRCRSVTSVGPNSYVFRAVANDAADAVIASTSDNIIKAYSLASSQLAHVCDLRGHGGTITDVAFTGGGGSGAAHSSSSLLHSSSVDGTVRGWDLRSGAQAER